MTTAPTAPASITDALEAAAALKVQLLPEGAAPDSESWITVCDLDRLLPGRGVAALLPDGRQAAVFRDSEGRVHAIGNHDPFTGAAVLSRGLVGSAEGRPYVASPLLKQRFDLIDGHCLDDEAKSVPVYGVRTV